MRIIQDISDFIFVNDIPQNADIIFLPGGSNTEPSERAAELWKEEYSPLILASGKYSSKIGKFPGPKTKQDIYNGIYETEADFMKSVLIHSGVDEKVILLDKLACDRGTFDNAYFSKEITDSMGLTINKAIIVCKSFHARRCLITYAWFYPNTEFFICPVDLENTSKDTWFTNPLGIEKVMSELQKCGQYFKDAIPLLINKITVI